MTSLGGSYVNSPGTCFGGIASGRLHSLEEEAWTHWLGWKIQKPARLSRTTNNWKLKDNWTDYSSLLAYLIIIVFELKYLFQLFRVSFVLFAPASFTPIQKAYVSHCQSTYILRSHCTKLLRRLSWKFTTCIGVKVPNANATFVKAAKSIWPRHTKEQSLELVPNGM